jgi:hypothetical protein
MITLIIGLVIFVLISLIIIFTEKGIGNIIGGIFTTLFCVSLVYGVLMLVVRLELRTNSKYTKYVYKELPIQSLINKSGFSVNGSFVLGTGNVSGRDKDYYVAYAMFEKGLLRVRVDASNTFIKETNDESPKIINFWVAEVYTGYKNKWFWNSKYILGNWEENKYGDKIVVVPKNTVYKDLFKIED